MGEAQQDILLLSHGVWSMGSSIVRLFQLLGHRSPVSIPTPSSDQRKHSVSNLFATLALLNSSSVDGGGSGSHAGSGQPGWACN